MGRRRPLLVGGRFDGQEASATRRFCAVRDVLPCDVDAAARAFYEALEERDPGHYITQEGDLDDLEELRALCEEEAYGARWAFYERRADGNYHALPEA